MGECFLQGHGACGGKISGEHYVSAAVLQAMSGNGTVQIGGLPWQPQQTLQRIGIRSLVTNVLCEQHNSALSPLDSAAGVLFRALDDADKNPASLPAVSSHDGPMVERWFLKVLCGLAAGMGFNNGIVPAQWKDALIGKPWPEGWGLYAPVPTGTHTLAPEFYLETLVNPASREVKAAKFRVAGVHFSLLVGRPDDASAWGTYHPQSFVFRSGSSEIAIEFIWPGSMGRPIVFTKLGTSTDGPPQWGDWKE